MDTDTARTAARFLHQQAAISRQRASTHVRLERLLRALRQWDEWYANAQLPPHQRRELETPLFDVDSLRTMLLEELALPEAED